MRLKNKNLIDFTFFTLFQYFLFILVLIPIYEGGNPVNPNETSFVWNLNFLSDLGRTHYFNGTPNPFWVFYNISLSIIGIGIFLYFYFLSYLIKQRFFKKLIILFGGLSGLGYTLISFFPADLYLEKHIQVGTVGLISFFIATLLLVIFIDRTIYRKIFYLSVVVLILLAFRILEMNLVKIIGIDKITLLKLQTISQKIVVFPQIFIAIIIFINLKNIFHNNFFIPLQNYILPRKNNR